MSRVFPNNKYLNLPRNFPEYYAPKEISFTRGDHGDYTKARTLTRYLFLRYGMSYKTFKEKSARRRNKIREEYYNITGQKPKSDVKEWWETDSN